MKKVLLFLLALCFSITIVAQENNQDSVKQNEIGIQFNDFENFGLTYKFGTSKSLFRINTILLSGNRNETNSFSTENMTKSLGFKLGFGKEFRSDISEKIELRYGVDLLVEYSKNEGKIKNESSGNEYFLDKKVLFGPGINLVIGFNYSINEQFFLGAEMLPHITYLTGSQTTKTSPEFISTEGDLSRLEYGLSNSSVMISITYKLK